MKIVTPFYWATRTSIRLVVVLFLGLIGLGEAHGADSRPNFVFILVDDLGKMDMTWEGSTFYETPNIDSLAKRSMRFINGYSACQVCSPSRAAIQTGKSPARLKITDYIGAPQPAQWKRNTKLLPASYELQLPLEEVTIAEALRAEGYQTFFAGKWHLGGKGFLPQDQGYSINKGGHAAGTPPGGFFSPYKNPELSDGPVGEQLPIRLGQETADFIRQSANQSSQPFFAMLSFYSVHAPIQTTEGLWKKYRDKAERLGLATIRKRFLWDRTQEVRQVQDNPLYAGMMESLDTAVGIVLKGLEDSGQAKNTIVIFTSDNGGVSSGDGYATSCLPMRGGKGRQWEGGIRGPLYIHWPEVTQGTDNATPAIGMDFFPTLLEMAQVKGNRPKDLDGISLVPALRGESLPERDLYWHYPHYGNQGGEPSAILRQGDWKLIHYFEDDRQELYQLSKDLGEQHDLSRTNADRTSAMLNQLQGWQQSIGARMPTPNASYDADKKREEIRQAQEVTMPNREKEHVAFFDDHFVPRGGWWQFRGAK